MARCSAAAGDAAAGGRTRSPRTAARPMTGRRCSCAASARWWSPGSHWRPAARRRNRRTRSGRSRRWLPCRRPARHPGAPARGSRPAAAAAEPGTRSRITSIALQEANRNHSLVSPSRGVRAEILPEQLPQVADYLGAFPAPVAEIPVTAPAGDAISEGGGKAGHGRRHRRPVATPSTLRSSLSARLSPTGGLLPSRLPRPEVGADGVHAVEILRKQIRRRPRRARTGPAERPPA